MRHFSDLSSEVSSPIKQEPLPPGSQGTQNSWTSYLITNFPSGHLRRFSKRSPKPTSEVPYNSYAPQCEATWTWPIRVPGTPSLKPSIESIMSPATTCLSNRHSEYSRAFPDTLSAYSRANPHSPCSHETFVPSST